jgi:upstream activation factor subunit UAF30
MNSVGTSPQYYEKFQKNIQLLSEQLMAQKNTTDTMIKQLKYIEKTANKMFEKEKKKKREPCKKKGFTQPVKISKTLANFMNLDKDTLISRTEVTKFLMKYIKDKQLENPDNKRQIWPDDELWELLGEDARKELCLTHFNLQKFMSKHFFH